MNPERRMLLKIDVSSNSIFAFNTALDRVLASLIERKRLPIIIEAAGTGSPTSVFLHEGENEKDGAFYVITVLSVPP